METRNDTILIKGLNIIANAKELNKDDYDDFCNKLIDTIFKNEDLEDCRISYVRIKELNSSNSKSICIDENSDINIIDIGELNLEKMTDIDYLVGKLDDNCDKKSSINILILRSRPNPFYISESNFAYLELQKIMSIAVINCAQTIISPTKTSTKFNIFKHRNIVKPIDAIYDINDECLI